MPAKDVIVAGGGLAGLSCAIALAEAGYRVRLFETRPRLGGRATSYLLPSGEYVDNCQHVTLGCCTNLADFYRRIGAADKIRWYRRLVFLDRHGKRGTIGPSWLPAPFHLAPSFAMFSPLSRADKWAVARVMMDIARSGGQPADAGDMTMLEWLHRRRQPKGAIERFWRVVLVSALNEELYRASARYGVEVFWKAFLIHRQGFELGIPAVPLADLYEGCRDVIARKGGQVRTSTGIREVMAADGRISAARLADGATVCADFFVAAIPHPKLLQILPREILDRDPIFANLNELRASPITGVHCWFDRPVINEPFVTLLDHTVQWIFNKSLLCGPCRNNSWQAESTDSVAVGTNPTDTQYLQLVISASHDLAAKSREEIIELCRTELLDVLPLTQHAQLLKAIVIKETAATFSPDPECDRLRPGSGCSLRNLFLAGDWTRTGWPATMEGAVRSGYAAAEAILAQNGQTQKFLLPDLPAQGLARLWAHK